MIPKKLLALRQIDIAKRLGISQCEVSRRLRAMGIRRDGYHGTRRVKEPRGKASLWATSPVSSRELEWAAGFIEGEGCFSARSHDTDIPSQSDEWLYKVARVSAYQVNPEPLLKMKALFGGSVNKPRIIGKLSKNLVSQWYVDGARARGLAMTLYILMSERRKKQARRLFEVQQ